MLMFFHSFCRALGHKCCCWSAAFSMHWWYWFTFLKVWMLCHLPNFMRFVCKCREWLCFHVRREIYKQDGKKMSFSLISVVIYVKLSDGKIQGFGGVRNATTPSIISEVPYAEEVACGGYHTCVVTSNTLLLYRSFFDIEFACILQMPVLLKFLFVILYRGPKLLFSFC